MDRSGKYMIFISLFILLIFAFLFIEPPKAFLFQNAKGDCTGRSIFMYNALYKDTSNADVVLFGSSHTLNGINDSLMTSLGERRFLNLGYCRFGRNLDYFFMEEYCKTHHPKKIILEVREHETHGTHPLTAFLLPVSKIKEDAYSFRTEIFENFYDKWLCNLKYIRGNLFSNLLPEPAAINTNHGFWYGNKITDIKPLIKKRYQDSIKYDKEGPKPKELNFNSKYYFDKLKALCQKKNIELNFLYMPSYGNVYGKSFQPENYISYGKILMPPDSIIKNVLNFSDYGHFNKLGADRVSTWLKMELEK